MAIEVHIRTGGDGGQSQTQTVSGLSLAETSIVTLGRSAPSLSGYSKEGDDLKLQFSDNQTLVVDKFFILGDEGQFSQFQTADGRPVVTGLMAPEPQPEADPSFAGALGLGSDIEAPEGQSTGESQSNSNQPGFSLAGGGDIGMFAAPAAVFAAGYGGGNLLSDDGDSDGAAIAGQQDVGAEKAGQQDEGAGGTGAQDETALSEISDEELAALVNEMLESDEGELVGADMSGAEQQAFAEAELSESGMVMMGDSMFSGDMFAPDLLAALSHESEV